MGSDVAAGDLGGVEGGPAHEADGVERLEGAAVVADEGVDAQEPHEREVAEHLEDVAAAHVAVGLLEGATAVGLELRDDVALVDEGLQVVEHVHNVPDLPNRSMGEGG